MADKYRPKPADTATDNPAPTIKTNGHTEPSVTSAAIDAASAEAVRIATNAASAADAASEQLKQQIANLRRGAEMQRQAAQPPTQEQMLAAVSPEWRSYLQDNPTLLSHLDIASQAAAHALQEGHQPNSEAQMRRTKELVEQHLGLSRAEPSAAPAAPAAPASPPPPAAPASLTPRPDRDMDERQAAMVSAPVSRQVPSADGGRYSASRVTLTPTEREFARSIGLSEENYALQKLRLNEMKSRGDIPG